MHKRRIKKEKGKGESNAPRLCEFLHNGGQIPDNLGDRDGCVVCAEIALRDLPPFAHQHSGIRTHASVHDANIVGEETDLLN